ncbi:hypothetical protein [Azospirillum palustre]
MLPSHDPTEVESGRTGQMLAMDFGEPTISGTPRTEGANSGIKAAVSGSPRCATCSPSRHS